MCSRKFVQRLSTTAWSIVLTCFAVSTSFGFSTACMEATGSIAAISVLPGLTSCTMTLQGSIVPTLSSIFNAS